MELESLKENVDRIMRHDLKGPLNSIVSIPQILKTEENITNEQLELIEYIQESGERMLNMVNNSLDLFKIESGSYEYIPQKVNVVPIILGILKQFSTRLSSKKLAPKILLNGHPLGKEEMFVIWSRKNLLDSLLSNLILNAIEASPREEEINISLSDSDPQVISIENKGSVPLRVRDNFFEKYKTEGKTYGTGLGTYSAKLMAEAMHYEISMQTSDEENSTCVNLFIPRNKVMNQK